MQTWWRGRAQEQGTWLGGSSQDCTYRLHNSLWHAGHDTRCRQAMHAVFPCCVQGKLYLDKMVNRSDQQVRAVAGQAVAQGEMG